MGKTARWFRGLLGGGGGGKKDSKDSSKEKKKWSFVKSFRDKDRHQQQPPPQPPASVDERRGSHRERSSSSSTNTYFDDGGTDPNKHAIAVAAATAAVAEAAVAAAHAAAAVVKLTNSGRCTAAYVSENGIRRDVWAAVKIQSAFRGYLARRALKALKGLVKLQALVRGHIIRKKTADEMRCMQALVRAQSRARASRSRSRSHSSGIRNAPGPATPEKYERNVRSNSTRHDRCSPLKRNSSKPNSRDVFDWDKTRRMDDRSWDYYRDTKTKYGTTDDDKSDKILEIDPGKPPHLNNKHWNSSQSSQQQQQQQAVVLDRLSFKDSPSKDSTTAQLSSSTPSSGEEVQSSIRRRPPLDVDDEPFCTAENSPQFYSAASIPGSSSRKGPFTPTKSDCSRSFASVYSDHPNYMSNTESSKAKARSQSAPKQRLEFEKSTSARRYNVNAFGDVRPSTAARRASTVQSSFTSKAYPGSGRLDRLGMPIQQYEFGIGGVYRNRY